MFSKIQEYPLLSLVKTILPNKTRLNVSGGLHTVPKTCQVLPEELTLLIRSATNPILWPTKSPHESLDSITPVFHPGQT